MKIATTRPISEDIAELTTRQLIDELLDAEQRVKVLRQEIVARAYSDPSSELSVFLRFDWSALKREHK